jgi:hypothetical protein
MTAKTGTSCVIGMALAWFGWMGLAVAQDQPAPSQPSQPSQMQQPSHMQPTQTMAQKMSATATVQKVDMSKRELTLKDAQGNTFMVTVPKDLPRFDAIKAGDRINLDYYQSLALSLNKTDAPPSSNEMAMVQPFSGHLPGGIVGKKISATVEVTNVDRPANKVSVKAPDGTVDTIHITDPGLRSQMGTLKAGDRIQLSYAEATAISFTPAGKE